MGQTNAEVFSLLTMVMLTGLILWLLWSLDHNQRADELATSINHVAERIVNAEEAARDRIVASISQIENRMAKAEQLAIIAASGEFLATLLAQGDGASLRAHFHAGGLTLSPLLYGVLPQTAKDFHELLLGEKRDRLTLTEHHLVDTFLKNLVEALPVGSLWLGITRLQNVAGWKDKSATAAYISFQTTAAARTRKEELHYCRLWGFNSQRHFQHALRVMRQQVREKFCIRYKVQSGLKDISIIWVPAPNSKPAKGDKGDALLAEILETGKSDYYVKLCAIEFVERGGRELDEMTIYSPRAPNFDDLFDTFKKNWRDSSPVPAEEQGDAA